jgi:predicted Zn-dependent protease
MPDERSGRSARYAWRALLPNCSLAVALICAYAVAGCAVNPVTGQPELSTMSPEREAALGAETAKQVAEEIGLVDDPKLAAYVDAVGQKLARHSPRRDVVYRFGVADMEEPNAFALPGGWIYVSRGLLAITGSEAELANILGHEIGHVAARHAASREARSVGAGALSLLGSVVSSATLGTGIGQGVGQIFQIAGAGLIASYSRGQEHQADEIGQQLAAQAGWDPAGMSRFLATLERDTDLRHDETGMPTFLSSHPVTAERVANTRRRAESLHPAPEPPVATSRAAFLAKLDGLLVGPDPAEGVFREARFLHPGLRFAIDFPAGWQTANGRSLVAAGSPEQDAIVLFEAQERGNDPLAAASHFAQASHIELRGGESARIGGYPAYRASATARTQQGTLGVDLTWIAFGTTVFRFTGLSPPSRFGARVPAFTRTALSFRTLSDRELASIRDLRLRIVEARSAEGIPALSRRTGNAWTPDETAVANGLPPGATLSEGEPLKIAVEVPYSR